MKSILLYLPFALLVCLSACGEKKLEESGRSPEVLPSQFLVVLGTAQDAGYPQTGCTKQCCSAALSSGVEKGKVTSLGLVDRVDSSVWLFEATPNFREQWSKLLSYSPSYTCQGIFLTHAHIGHYTGLMQLGRESMGASNQKVYAMPKMKSFIETNGPWSQLVSLNNISLQELSADSSIELNPRVRVTPIRVPHRDEFSETVGYIIQVNSHRILFIPDIDKWEKWKAHDIANLIPTFDYAFLDGTFYGNGELPGRDMSEIPHPFVEESIERFADLSEKDRKKIHFIHFNHTNPLLWDHKVQNDLNKMGYQYAREGQIVNLSK